MAEIHYKQFPAHLKALASGGNDRAYSPVFLIYGEEYLCKTAFDALVDALVPGPARALGYEPVDGSDDAIADAVQRANTYALVPGKKVVAIVDSQVFHSSQDAKQILSAAKKAFDADNMKKAARTLLNLLALSDVDMDEADTGSRVVKGWGPEAEGGWLADLVRYCRERNMTVPRHADLSQVLESAIEHGFPAKNHLVIVSDIVDKRRRLYKLLLERGTVVDCSVPTGARKSDKTAQEDVLREKMASILKKAGKTADNQAYSEMVNMTGFDLRTFINNLEKLVSYVGERHTITGADVENAIKRTKKDPIFEFTNAVTDRRLDTALFFMDSLLSDPDVGHPLQLLAAVINQMRKLAVVKGFVQGDNGGVWYAGCPYNIFQSKVMPVVQNHDRALLARLGEWENDLEPPQETGGAASKKSPRKKPKIDTDLVIAKNPNNAFPVYQMFKKAEHFQMNELVSLISELSLADLRLKTTGQAPERVLEKMIFTICRHDGQ